VTKALVGNVLYGFDAEVIDFVAGKIPGFVKTPGATALGIVRNKKLVAGIVYERCNGVNVEVSIAIDDRRWATRDTMHQIFNYPFGQLGCHCITVLVASTNPVSMNLAAKMGFEVEAIIKFAASDGSHVLVMKAFSDKCKWVKNHGKRRRSPRGT